MPRQNRPKRETKKQSTKTTVKKINPSVANPPVPAVKQKDKNEIQTVQVRQRASMRDRAAVTILTAHPQTETGQKPVIVK